MQVGELHNIFVHSFGWKETVFYCQLYLIIYDLLHPTHKLFIFKE